MAVHFTQEDWKRIRESHTAWWRGELKRPLVQCVVEGAYDAGRPQPAAPVLSQVNCNRLDIPAEDVIDALDWKLSRQEFLGDAYPRINFDSFGPGVTAAFCGAVLDNSAGGVWFFPEEKKPISEISIRYNPENKWVRRIKDIYRAGGERWQGNVLMGMPDLGGFMDIAATFVGSEEMLIELYDEPEEVRRLSKEAYQAFMEAYRDLEKTLIECGNPGYSDWSGLYSDVPSYIIQNDFSYMIGPDMFREFGLTELAQATEELDNVIYHLDGAGQIPHLDYLLALPKLKAIQWVPGDGQPHGAVWLDLYRRISAAGRRIWFVGSDAQFEEVLREVPDGMYYSTGSRDREEAARFLERIGVPV